MTKILNVLSARSLSVEVFSASQFKGEGGGGYGGTGGGERVKL